MTLFTSIIKPLQRIIANVLHVVVLIAISSLTLARNGLSERSPTRSASPYDLAIVSATVKSHGSPRGTAHGIRSSVRHALRICRIAIVGGAAADWLSWRLKVDTAAAATHWDSWFSG